MSKHKQTTENGKHHVCMHEIKMSIMQAHARIVYVKERRKKYFSRIYCYLLPKNKKMLHTESNMERLAYMPLIHKTT